MVARRAYDVSEHWDDPYDRRPELRSPVRCATNFKAYFVPQVPGGKPLRRTKVIFQSVSTTGAYLLTAQRVTVGQSVHVRILTDFCPEHLGFPSEFSGTCRVTRVDVARKDRYRVALRFGERFNQSMDFTLFLDYLNSVSGLMSA